MTAIMPDEGIDYIMAIFPKNGTNIATLYLGLFSSQTPSTVPGRTSVLATSTGVTEVSGTGYARISLAAASWGAQATLTNGRSSTFPQQTFTGGAGGWTTANGFFIATASSAGIAIAYFNFASGLARTLGNGDTLKITPTLEFNGISQTA